MRLTYRTKTADAEKLRLLTREQLDGRTKVARRFKDICRAIATDQGGADKLSETRAQLIRRFAAAAVLAEQLEARIARGEEITLTDHALLCSSLVRLAQRIGIGRRARDVTPSLSDYLANRNQKDAA
jgi:antitoxin (DNA-binding transcriptional repressor) of toxin-antitoxin stability system